MPPSALLEAMKGPGCAGLGGLDARWCLGVDWWLVFLGKLQVDEVQDLVEVWQCL